MKKGVVLLLMTAVLWSLGGLWVKFIDWNPVAIAGARGLIAFAVLAVAKPQALRQLTWGAVPGALAYAAVMFLFVIATKLTTAANAVFLHYTAPLHIALIGPWLLGERTRRRDWALIGLALGGVALFFCNELDLQSRWGVLAGLGSGFCSAWLIMLMRRARTACPEAVAQLGNLLTLAVASPWMFPAHNLGHNALWLLLLGGLSLGVPYVLYSRAIREVRALDATLITMVEPILNPVWVMLAAHECPSGWSVLGGAVVLTTSLIRSILASKDEGLSTSARRPPSPFKGSWASASPQRP
ncbi:MAG: DMT family transporter [Verrucomicrobia bacterium]|nr:DMT family transporter [Verrucomicrobiota bacterium]